MIICSSGYSLCREIDCIVRSNRRASPLHTVTIDMDCNLPNERLTPILHKKLHYGCGDIQLKGFLNYDFRKTLASEKNGTLEDLLMTNIGSFEIIYLCHVLEHFPLPTIVETLSKFKRLLIPGKGMIFISVPDFETLVSMYLSHIVPLSTIIRAIHGGQEYQGNTHFISFDTALLTSCLKEAGFINVRKYEPATFLDDGIKDTSTYRIAGRLISLNIQANG